MIVLGSYEDFKCENQNVISISKDGGKKANFKGSCYPVFAPCKNLLDEWDFYKGRCSEEVRERMFINKYYFQVLERLDAETLYKLFDNKIVLDYENSPVRYIIGAWFELLLGVKSGEYGGEEVQCAFLGNVPNENIKVCLEEVMKEKCDMRGFQSLQAAYLYRKSLERESKGLMSEACLLRCDADEAEEKYLSGEENVQLTSEKWQECVGSADVWFEECGTRLCTTPRLVLKKKELDGQMRLY